MFEVRLLNSGDTEAIAKVSRWMYEWWGEDEHWIPKEMDCYIRHSLGQNSLPQTYGAFQDGVLVGCFQFTLWDLLIRSDIYPWLANVYIAKEFRGKGLGRLLLEAVPQCAASLPNTRRIYLYTEHHDFYEKFGWVKLAELDTITKKPRLQSLYALELAGR